MTIKVELKSIKSYPSMSRGTAAYSAKILVDGVLLGEVSNDGNGGCDRFQATGKNVREANSLYDEACRRVKDEMPRVDLADPGEPENLIEDSMDFLCARIVADHDLLKRLRRMMKTKVLVFDKGRPDRRGAPLYEYRLSSPASLPGVAAGIRRKHPDAWILNEQSEEDAIAALKLAG